MNTRRKILVVEDSIANRRTLCKILSQEYETLEAVNGQEALEILSREAPSISLIFVDLWIPAMDGYTFLKRLQTDQVLTAIPVIVAIRRDREEDAVEVLACGAADFITKPYRPRVILHRASSIISLRETTALIDQMEYDRLTGLYSQVFFCHRVRQVLQQNPETQYDLLCSNIENFRFINEVFGLTVGDQVLRLIARELQYGLPGEHFCGRLQADIFACMLARGPFDLESALSCATERIRKESGVKSFSMKWGVYAITDIHLPVEQMCEWALLACNSISKTHDRTVAVCNDALRQTLLREKTLENGMEAALNTRQFEIFYQPKFSLRSNRIGGAEALVRWNHPTLGLLLPEQFIPLFERNGFITRLDRYIWEEVAVTIHNWELRGMPPVPVSVNVSRADIYNADLEAVMMDIRRRHQIKPSLLHLEITETAYTEDPRQLYDVVTKLRGAGFVIEMDDFGSGYSSLNMLNELPIDILKLDVKFLKEGLERGKRRSILSFVVSLARWLDLQVIAEGVESSEQVEKLRNAGCNFAQGHYFSPPLPHLEFEQFLQNVDDFEEENTLKDDNILEKTRLLEAAAYEDYLTGLLNRRGLDNALTQLDFTQANIAIFVFDMDNLKCCNDSKGHTGGDEMLRRFSGILRAHTRGGDIISRIGGDEFVAVMPQMRSFETAMKKGQEICRTFRDSKPSILDGCAASCSAGLAMLQNGESFEDAFTRADRALYRAKSNQKGVCFA
jgi:diguanylate cyclase (GGDEF)-like protein